MNLFRLNSIFVFLAIGLAGMLELSHAQNVTWDGGGLSGNWSDTGNWGGSDVSGGNTTLIFGGNTNTTTNNNLADPAIPYTGLQFTNDGSGGAANGTFILSGNAITLGGDIVTTATGGTELTDTINLDLILNGNRTVTANDNHNLILNGNISGGFELRTAGNAAVTLSGNNTFTSFRLGDGSASTWNGTTGDKQGFVIVNHNNALGTGSVRSIGGQLQAGVGGIVLSNTINIDSGGLRVGGSNDFELAGPINVINDPRDVANYGTANITVSGQVNLNDGAARGITFRSSFDSAGDWLMTGNIIGGAGTYVNSASDYENGRVVFTGNNSYDSTNIAASTTFEVGTGGADGTLGTGAVSNAGTLIFNRSGTLTIGGPVTGTGQFTQMGPGTTIWEAGNTINGNITISNGTLQIGNSTTANGAINSAVTNNSALVFDQTGTQTVNGSIGGTGTVTQSGNGTTNLNGDNNYSGATAVNSGQLNISGTNTSDITVAAGANLGGEGSTSGNIVFSGTTHTLDIDGSTSAALGSTGSGSTNVSALNVGGFTVNLNNYGAGNVTVLTYGSGGFTGATDRFAAGTGMSARGVGGFSDDMAGNIVLDAGFVTNTWQGTAANSTFWDGNTTANWSNSKDSLWYDGDDAIFDDTASNFTPTLQNSITAGTVSFNNNSNDYTLASANASYQLDASNGIFFNGSGNVTVSAVLAGSGTLNQTGSGTTTITGTPTYSGTTNITGGHLIFVDGAITDNRVYGPISSGATLELNYATNGSNGGNNNGIMNLSGNGTFIKSGGATLTQVSAGSTIAMGSSGLYHIKEGVFIFGGGGIGDWSSNLADAQIDSGARFETSATPAQFDALSGNGTINIGGGLTLGVNNSDGNNVFNGILQNDDFAGHNLVKVGSGTQILAGNNTYDGGTTISGGTLQIGNGGASGLIGTGAVVNNANLVFDRTGTYSVAEITGSGNTTVSNGTLNLTGSNYNTNLVVASGANIGGEGSNTGDITFQGTTHTLDIDASTAAALGTVGSATTDIGAVTGNITVNVSGTNSGPITVLTFGSGGLGGGNVSNFVLGTATTVRGGGSFAQTSNAIVLSLGFVDNVWQGNDGANPTFWDDGVTDNWLNASDTKFFEGDTAIFDDTATGTSVALQSDISANAVTFNNSTKNYDISAPASQTLTAGSALTFSNGGNVTVANNVNLTANGGLIFSNSGNVTITSATVTTNGTLTFNNSGDVTMNGGTLNHSGTIDFAGSGNTTISNTFAGVGSLIHSGSGTTTLTGSKAHTGTKTVTNGTLVLEQNAIDADTTTIGAGATLEVRTTAGGRSISTWDHGGDGTWKKTGTTQFNQISSGSDITYTANGLIHVAEGRYQFGGGTPGIWQNNKGSLLIDAGANFDGRATSIWIDRLLGEGLMQIGGKGTNGLYALTLGISNGSGVFTGNIQNGTEGSATNRDIFKTGTGTQTLSGTNNTYTGQTIIDQGRLNMAGTFTSVNDITVGANGTLGGEGTVAANLVFNAGSTLAIDPSTGGALTTTAGVTTAGAGNVTVFLDGTPTPGNILVFSYGSGTVNTADLVLGTTGTFRDGTFTDNAGANVTLNLGNVNNTWTGANTTNPTFWDINGTNNWNAGGNVYYDADNVTFTDDVGLSAGNVVIQGNLTAGSVTFTNTSGGNTYNVTSASGNETLSATGGINVNGGGTVTMGATVTGSTAVSVTGSSTLVLNSANSDTTGGISVANGSTLQVTSVGRLNGLSVDTTDGGLVQLDRNYQNGNISGNGGVTIISGGTLDLDGTHSYTGDTNINGTTDFRSSLVTSSASTYRQNSVSVDLENGFNGTVKSWQQSGAGNLRFGYNNTGGGSATLTVLENSQFTSIQVLTTGTLNLADGVSANITSAISQLGDPDSFNANVGAGGFLNITGAINSGNGNGAFNTGGAGTVRVTNTTSAFGGGTRISNGTLEFNSIANRGSANSVDSSLGNAEQFDVLQIGSDSNSATLRMIQTNAKNSSNRAVQIGDAGGTIEIAEAAQTLTLSGIVSGNGSTGNGALTTKGPGTIALEGANTYTGGTTVESGTLLVNNTTGSGTGSGDVTVASGANLGGTGTISARTTITGGHHAGANTDAGTVGTMTFGSDLVYNSGAAISWDLIENSTMNPSTGFDTFAVGGTLDFGALGGENFTFNITLGGSVNYYDPIWQNLSTEWKVWDVTSIIGFDAGEFTINLTDTGVSGGPQSASIFTLAEKGDGIYLQLTTAVPEPSTFTLMGLGLAGFGWFVRRRKKAAQATDEGA